MPRLRHMSAFRAVQGIGVDDEGGRTGSIITANKPLFILLVAELQSLTNDESLVNMV